MRLYVEELKDQTLTQVIAVHRKFQLSRIRLHLCKYLSPAGTFTLTLKDSEENVITSKSMTLAEMQAAATDDMQASYYHGYVSFVFPKQPILKPDTYTLELSTSGYTYAEGEFIGWCKAWDDPAIALTGGGTPVPSNRAYDFETYSVQRVR